MKALILAAGKGSRLGELARATPKPLLSANGRKPSIIQNIEMCARAGIRDILINLHYLGDVIRRELGDGSRFGVNITYREEREILGTSGAVKNFADLLAGSEPFVVLYGDNFCDYDLLPFLQQHRGQRAEMSIVLFEKEDVRQSGVALMGQGGWIRSFIEKPTNSNPPSRWVNMGVYIMEPALLADLPGGFSDFGKDILPRWCAQGRKILGIRADRAVIAIDTPEMLQGTPCVFLDRDGVLNQVVLQNGKPHPPQHLSEFEILPGVPEACERLRAAGYKCVVVTNQPDVATGKQTLATVEEMNSLLASQVKLDSIRMCLHRDSDNCPCRKPLPGMLLDAAREMNLDLSRSFIVGDRWRDIDAGKAAGCRTIWIRQDYAEKKPSDPDWVAGSLREATDLILSL